MPETGKYKKKNGEKCSILQKNPKILQVYLFTKWTFHDIIHITVKQTVRIYPADHTTGEKL
jgi:hypothetical protein